jgi:hypothetical protein
MHKNVICNKLNNEIYLYLLTMLTANSSPKLSVLYITSAVETQIKSINPTCTGINLYAIPQHMQLKIFYISII